MACPTTEQLAGAALGLDDAATSHVGQCADCQAKLADLRQTSHGLAAAHATLDRGHAQSRAALLTKLSHVELLPQPVTAWRRFAFGGIGLSSAIAALLLLGIFANSTNQLSAMERIVNAVREVKSFSYKLQNVSDVAPRKDKPARTYIGETFTYWQAPPVTEPDQFGNFRGTQINKWVFHYPTGDQGPTVIGDIIEIHPSGKPGILIDYEAKKFYRVPALHAGDIAGSTPLLWLRAVREKAGRLIEDLGTRRIGGRDARGYVMTFDDAEPFDIAADIAVRQQEQVALLIRRQKLPPRRRAMERHMPAQPEAVETLASVACARLGDVDLLCANAGITTPFGGAPDETPLTDWHLQFDVNVFGVVHCLQAFLPRMRAKQSRSHVLITRYDVERVKRGEMLKVEDVIEMLALPLLGVIPESQSVLQASNVGAPVVLDQESKAGQAYRDAVARYLGQQLEYRFVAGEKSIFGFGFFNRLWRRSA